MIEAVPQQEMINIPGLGPMPIRNLPQGMGELSRRAPWHARIFGHDLDICVQA